VVALGVAGANLRAIAVGGGFAAVIVGLAAQQTLGNCFAGMVLLSARPFRVGERVRLQAGSVGGTVEGIVSSLGLLYTTLTAGADQIMIPNSVVLAAVVVPLREPEPIDVRVRLGHGVRPTQVQAILDNEIATPTRSKAVLLEEIDGDDLVVRIQATPESPDDGARLADEVMAALSSVTGEHAVQTAEPPPAGGSGPGASRSDGTRPDGMRSGGGSAEDTQADGGAAGDPAARRHERAWR
jgi:small-conductance mechanosensitive channel